MKKDDRRMEMDAAEWKWKRQNGNGCGRMETDVA